MSNAERVFERQAVKNTKASLYNDKHIDFTKEPMFFGKGRNVQRFDVLKYKNFDKLNDDMQGFDWKHDEVSLIKDIKDFRYAFKNPEKFVLTRVLQKLIFLDSLQGRGPFLILGQIATLPELENAILTWTYFEAGKHSRTYTEELRALYDHPDKIFDESFEIPELLELTNSIKNPFERAYFNVINYIYKTQRDIELTHEETVELYDAILMVIIEINTLEGIRFYTGFAAIWALTEGQKYIPGTSENLCFISRDENIHLAISQHLLKNLKKKDEEGFKEYYKAATERIQARYIEVFREEVKWVDYLFSQGSYLGMNANILKQYLTFITIKRMKAIGIKVTKEMLDGHWCVVNPIPWVDKYINMDSVEKLPQEENVLNYVTGGVNQDVDESTEIEIALQAVGNIF